MTETINGLHKCQPKNAPQQGEIKNMVVLNMPARGEKKAWIKIKSEKPEKGGSPYRILGVEKLDWLPDDYGNIAFNIEVEASSSPTTFQQARATMQQGETNSGRIYDNNDVHVIDGVTEARRHLMQSCNLLNLCIAAVDKAIAPTVPEIVRTSEFFQAQVATLFIEASREVWWSGKIVKESYLSKMPTKPID